MLWCGNRSVNMCPAQCFFFKYLKINASLLSTLRKRPDLPHEGGWLCPLLYCGRTPAISNKYRSGWSSQSAALILTHRCRSASFTCHRLMSSCRSRCVWSPQPHTSMFVTAYGIDWNSICTGMLALYRCRRRRRTLKRSSLSLWTGWLGRISLIVGRRIVQTWFFGTGNFTLFFFLVL